MNREQPFDRLQFDEDAILNDNVEAIAAFHKEVLVLNGQRVLADEPKTSQPEFGTETRLVRRFEDPGPKQRWTSMSAPMTASVPYSNLPISRSPCSTSVLRPSRVESCRQK